MLLMLLLKKSFGKERKGERETRKRASKPGHGGENVVFLCKVGGSRLPMGVTVR